MSCLVTEVTKCTQRARRSFYGFVFFVIPPCIRVLFGHRGHEVHTKSTKEFLWLRVLRDSSVYSVSYLVTEVTKCTQRARRSFYGFVFFVFPPCTPCPIWSRRARSTHEGLVRDYLRVSLFLIDESTGTISGESLKPITIPP